MFSKSIAFTDTAIVVTGAPQSIGEFTVPMVAGRTYYIEHEFRLSGGLSPGSFVASAPGGSTGHYGGAELAATVSSSNPQTRLMGVVQAGANGDFTVSGDASGGSFTIEPLASIRVEEHG